MVAARRCTYSPNETTRGQFESIVLNTGCHLVVAGVVNALFLYWLEAEDLLPGILVGSGAAIAQNLTHKIAHLETHYRKDLRECCHLPYGGDLLLGAFLTYVISKRLLIIFDYRAGGGAVIRLSVFAMISIATYNRTQKS